MAKQAKQGDTVKVHYTGRLKDGTVFDTSVDGGEPIEFTLGEGRVIAGFDEGVRGMEIGESRTLDVPPDKAYGEHNKDLLFEVSREQLPEDVDPEVGDRIALQSADAGSVLVTVSEVSEATVTFDANHPLAGEHLTFDVELVEIAAS